MRNSQAVPLRDQLLFLRSFLRDPASVGAVAPSSAALARAMTAELTVNSGDCVVEFGPGTGAFTRQVARLIDGGGDYLGIERDATFVALLRERFPELRFMHGSAEEAGRHHADSGLGRVCGVLSGLPFASLPVEVQDRIITTLRVLLQPGGEFRTFQYAHAYPLPRAVRFRKRMSDVFGRATVSRCVLRNLPPAFVLTWRG